MNADNEDLAARLENHLRASQKIMLVLEAARRARLPDWRLFAGAIYQTVWNGLTGRTADYGIKDYDIGYFDQDLSEAAETAHRQAVQTLVPEELRASVEIVNQARVHLWFEQEFGRPYPALSGTDEMLPQSLFTSHAVAIRLEEDDRLTIAAPYGLADIFDMVLRPTPGLAAAGPQAEKARAALARWPELAMVESPGEP